MKTLVLLTLLAATDDPASQPTRPNKVYGIYVDGKEGKDIAALLIIFGAPTIIAAVAMGLRYKRRMAREATLRLAIEQGDKVSPEVMQILTADLKPKETAHALPSAVFLGCLFAGIGCIPAFGSYGVMLFFMFMGIGFVLRAYLTTKK